MTKASTKENHLRETTVEGWKGHSLRGLSPGGTSGHTLVFFEEWCVVHWSLMSRKWRKPLFPQSNLTRVYTWLQFPLLSHVAPSSAHDPHQRTGGLIFAFAFGHIWSSVINELSNIHPTSVSTEESSTEPSQPSCVSGGTYFFSCVDTYRSLPLPTPVNANTAGTAPNRYQAY